jgi:hypothetical protein
MEPFVVVSRQLVGKNERTSPIAVEQPIVKVESLSTQQDNKQDTIEPVLKSNDRIGIKNLIN